MVSYREIQRGMLQRQIASLRSDIAIRENKLEALRGELQDAEFRLQKLEAEAQKQPAHNTYTTYNP